MLDIPTRTAQSTLFTGESKKQNAARIFRRILATVEIRHRLGNTKHG